MFAAFVPLKHPECPDAIRVRIKHAELVCSRIVSYPIAVRPKAFQRSRSQRATYEGIGRDQVCIDGRYAEHGHLGSVLLEVPTAFVKSDKAVRERRHGCRWQGRIIPFRLNG